MSLGMVVFAENPILKYHYLADPTAVVVGDSVFYIISDTDYDSYDNYQMKAGYLVSSKDMKNWTDHGEIFRVPRDVSWANGVWAPAATWHNDKMYIYFPDGAYGVGVVSSSNPAGPYTDPIGGRIIEPGRGHCDGIAWCFDPGVFVDDDGQGYLVWGGGENEERPYGYNFSVVRLNEDMISWSGDIIRMSGMDRSFEAPYITKHNGTYYLSYNAQGQTIDYATSDSPTGPWNYQGTVMANPNINGQNINAYNNNHHGFAEFKGEWYAAYHDRRNAIANNDPQPAYHRSISIDRLVYNADGTLQPLVFTNEGPDQIGTFNPYDSIPAATSSAHQNITTRTDVSGTGPVQAVLIPKTSGGDSWIRVSGVNFGSGGAYEFIVDAASVESGSSVEIRTGSSTGPLAGTCQIENTGSWNSYAVNTCNVSGLTGTVPELYLSFSGADSTFGMRWWRFREGEPVPQGPYGESAAAIPGKIEFEHFDVGGNGEAYFDDSWGSETGVSFRTDEDVDIEECTDEGGGYNIGWFTAGEWLEYTVDVAIEGVYDLVVRVACDGDNRDLNFYMDGDLIAGDVAVPNTGGWQAWQDLIISDVSLQAGEQVLRVAAGDTNYINLNYIEFVPAESDTLPTAIRTARGRNLEYQFNSAGLFYRHENPNATVQLLDMQGKVLHTSSNQSGVLSVNYTGVFVLQVIDVQGQILHSVTLAKAF